MSTAPDATNQFDALRDAILRGMAHALSNRVAALGGVSMLADPGQIWTERLSKALQDEARRLEEILRLMRLLPNDGRGEPGAVELQPLIPDVVALHAYNSALLQVECATVHDRETMPVYANRPQLVHALLLAIDTGKRHAMARGARVVVSYAGDSERVMIRVATEPSANARPANGGGDSGAAPTAAMEAVLPSAIARVGGSFPVAISADDGALRIEISVPTLAAGRRSERSASAARPVG
ncbi:MAG: hypothetical protein ACJ79K_14895 [Gemmatimonadaceae bacterium]